MTEIDLNVTQTAHDLTIMGLFWAADPLVKFVMILLVGASIWCWAIIFEKIVGLRRESARAQHFDNEFWSGGSLDDLYDATGVIPIMRKHASFQQRCENGAAHLPKVSRSLDVQISKPRWLIALIDL